MIPLEVSLKVETNSKKIGVTSDFAASRQQILQVSEN